MAIEDKEEEALLTWLEEIMANGGRYDNGSFKLGLCPNFGLKSNPHINSKMRKWKKQCRIIYDMENKSGFTKNEIRTCIEVNNEDV